MGLLSKVGSTGEGAQNASLRAEVARLQQEVERLRLQQAGVHPASALVEAMRDADLAADTADSSATMYVSALAMRSELREILTLLKATVEDFEVRLQRLDRGLDPAATAVELDLRSHDPAVRAAAPDQPRARQ